MYKYLLTIAASSLLVLGACKKKDGTDDKNRPDVNGKTKRQIFMMQDWRWAEALDSAENEFTWKSEMDACNTDDVYTFKTGDKISVSEGSNDCLPGDPNTYSMDWSMPSDNANTMILGLTQWAIIKMANEEIVLWREWNSGQEQHYKKLIFKRN